MNIINKMILFLKNLFNKQEHMKELQASKQHINQGQKNNFLQSIKLEKKENKKHKNIETLICTGDGLGIQKKISY